ncbi:MAG: NAD(P)H-dependent oxidoreductase [Bacilli bacterium]
MTMKVLIIYAHPTLDSLNGHLFGWVKSELQLAGHEVNFMDLYREGFDPVLRWGDDLRRRDLKDVPEMKGYQASITWADHLMFIYPTWWARRPAILEGFIDRLFTSGFAYESVPGKPLPKGLLAGKSASIIHTEQGPTGFYRWGYLLNAQYFTFERAVLSYVGITDVKRFTLGDAEQLKEERLVKFKEKVAKWIATL